MVGLSGDQSHSCFPRLHNKDSPITQEIPVALETLFQEPPGPKTRYIIYFTIEPLGRRLAPLLPSLHAPDTLVF